MRFSVGDSATSSPRERPFIPRQHPPRDHSSARICRKRPFSLSTGPRAGRWFYLGLQDSSMIDLSPVGSSYLPVPSVRTIMIVVL